MSYRLCMLWACTLCAACLPFDDVSQGDPWKTREAEPVEEPVEEPIEEKPAPTEDPVESCLREPALHRRAAEACDADRPAGGAIPPFVGDEACTNDADCTDGDNGRCLRLRFGLACSYDQCFEDSDCGSGICACEGALYSDANQCIRVGNCRTDADCGETGYCSPSFGPCGAYAGVMGYFCHTCDDACVEDSDCADPGSYCAYNESAGMWACSNSYCDG